MRRAYCAVVLLALVCLLPRAALVGMTGDYVDSIGKITAQDEALYGNSAIAMAQRGDWLTPHFMGRPALYKPPMLIWASAASAKLLGVGRVPLRLPVALIAALAVGLIFLWGAEAGGIVAGACAALLVLGNHLFHTLSTLVMTDVMLLAFTSAAVYAIYSDPWLESRGALWGYAAASAGAILTKGVAGVFPVAVLGMYWLAVRPKERPRLARAATALALTGALAAPWFLYQLAAHPRWFWTEHIAVEILGFGAGAPPQTSRENTVLFYLLRLAAQDPILFAAAVIALPAFVRALRKRESGPVLLACWLTLTTAATLAWQYRNASYLLALVPSLALIAACYGTFAERRHSTWMLAFVAFGLVLKGWMPDSPWGLNYREGTINPVGASLTEYCEAARGKQLIVVDVVDDLYAASLPIRLRYASVGNVPRSGAYGMPFRDLGIVLPVEEHLEGNAAARYRGRLLEWSVESDEAVGTLIAAASVNELGELVRRSPDTDFLLPVRYPVAVDGDHTAASAGRGFVWLLSNSRTDNTARISRTCRM
jgi:hypothetical protein